MAFQSRIHFAASERHFVDHLVPIWHQLPEEVRGRFHCGLGRKECEQALARARTIGVPDARPGWLPPGAAGIGVVASVGDLANARKSAPRIRFAYTEHGCGLTYQQPGPSYIGSGSRDGVDLIIVPSDRAADIQKVGTPHIRIESVGCSPKMDGWAPGGPLRDTIAEEDPPVVAVSWHYDAKNVVMEVRSALPYYERILPDLAKGPWQLIGHGHPRYWGHCRAVYEKYGIEPVKSFEEVLRRASLYVVDNSSTLYEFAATGRPVVAVNCPLYRRDVHHGLRFWEHIPGLQCDEPEDLPRVVARALEDPPEARKAREAAVSEVYPQMDGKSAERAAALLLEALGESKKQAPGRAERVYVVVDAEGEKVEEYRTEYEAKTHARKIGGRYSKGEAALTVL